MESKQWTRGEDFREFVFNSSHEMWGCVILAGYGVSERNAYLFPDFKNIYLSISWSHSRPIKSPDYLTSFISGKSGIFEITYTQTDY